MNFLVYIFGFLTLILIITAIHEAGHYSMARFFKVTVLDFSIGMVKSLKSWKDSLQHLKSKNLLYNNQLLLNPVTKQEFSFLNSLSYHQHI